MCRGLRIIPAKTGRNLLVTGSTGRIGRLLRLLWRPGDAPALPVVWCARPHRTSGDAATHGTAEPATLIWNHASALPDGWPEGAVILHLAGVVAGDAGALEANVELAHALARAARARGAAHVLFASSVAVYRPGPDAIAETEPPDPPSAYGRSKAAAEAALKAGLAGSGTGLTCLRIANLAGADALLGGARKRGGEVTLDHAPGRPAGLERSYIGPQSLAGVLARLVDLAAEDPMALPEVLNFAQPGAVAMGDLLTAAGLPWRFGPGMAPAPRVVVDCARLQALAPLPPATPASLVAELATLEGTWP